MFGLKLAVDLTDNYGSLHFEDCGESVANIQQMVEILERDKGALERKQMPFLSTPLRDAASRGHVKCMKFLLSQGADIECEDRRGSTPLDAAVVAGHGECVKTLLEASADPNHTSQSNPSISKTACLTKACMLGNLEIVQLLLQYGALTEDLPTSAEDYLISTPASTAVVYGHVHILGELLLHGAVIDLSTLEPFSGRPRLVAKHSLTHLCVLHRNKRSTKSTEEILNLLHKFGANFNQEDSQGLTALELLRSNKVEEDQLEEILELHSARPLSLKAISRLYFVKYFGRRYVECIKTFEIPTELSLYLEFLNN